MYESEIFFPLPFKKTKTFLLQMSSFIIQTVTDFWPTAIADVIAALQPQNIPSANVRYFISCEM